MPKTDEFMKNQGAVEMMGYNKVGDNSLPNLLPLLMGYSINEINHICHPVPMTTFDDCPFLWHRYKDAGYYTAFGEDSGYLGTFNYHLKGFRKTPTDYYMHPFISEAEKAINDTFRHTQDLA
ncbi:hypothetical protein O0L34_g11479 [Tuta absoluta]|nr:hypothetical protein O0L34_g11479 [Tuta absoluta]